MTKESVLVAFYQAKIAEDVQKVNNLSFLDFISKLMDNEKAEEETSNVKNQ